MVELFAAGCLARTPELVAPAAPVTECGLPTRAKLNELLRPDPLDGIRLVQEPLAQVPPALAITATFTPGASSTRPERGLSPSPVFNLRHCTYGIELTDYAFHGGVDSPLTRGRDYSREPPSNWTSPSPGIQLYG